MHNPNQESAISGPINLLKHYSFESNYQSYERVLDSWLERFPLDWVNLALVESLYQGRYKVVSVEQILTLWQRRGKASYHFNHDFERLVSNNLPEAFDKRVRLSSKHSPSPTKSSSRPRSQPYPILTDFNTGTTQNKSMPTDPPSGFSQDIPPLPKPSSHLSTPRSESSASINSSSPSDTQLEATKPSTIIEKTESASTESVDQLVQHRSGAQSHELPSEDHSTSSKSVSTSSPVSKTLQSIHQFVPQSSSPEFSSKLTAMAQVDG